MDWPLYSALCNLLHLGHTANILVFLPISRIFLATYADGGNFLNRPESASNNTSRKNLTNESIATSERRNLSWYLKIQRRIHKSVKFVESKSTSVSFNSGAEKKSKGFLSSVL